MTEPATKRQKTAGALTETDEDDELFLEPEELNQRRDPAFLLVKERARAATQLKSRFEDIFAKYEKDFTGVGDEIDLATGEVVVDNGHLSSMRSMKDWIVDDDEDGDEDEDEDQNGQGEEGEQASPGNVDEKFPDSADSVAKDPWRIAEPGRTSELESRGPPLGSLLSTQFQLKNPRPSSSPLAPEPSISADPAWQAPELPASAFLSQTLRSNGRHYGGATPVVTRTVLKSSIPAPDSPEAYDEDDLQTAVGNLPERNETGESSTARVSPLLKMKFPVVDSSPQDNSLNELIHEVIENIPDTPPSIRQSRFLRSPGRPFPLNQEHRIHPRTKSKLRISDTPHDGNSREAPKKRGRKPKVRVDPIFVGKSPRTQRDQISWEECDEPFLDVTSQGIIKPAGQTLYVEIRSLGSTENGTATPEDLPVPSTLDADAEDEDFRARGNVPVRSPVKDPEATNTSNATLSHQDATTITGIRQMRALGKTKPQDDFQRNIVDPAFIFSDEETLLPKRSRQKRRHSKPSRGVTIPSPPLVDLQASEQIVADEHSAGAEHELTVLAREEGASRCRKNTSKPERAGGVSPMLVKAEAMDTQIPEYSTPDCITEEQRPRIVRLSGKPHLTSGTTRIQGKTPLHSAGIALPSSKDVEGDIGSNPQDFSPLEQETEQPMAEADTGISRLSWQSTAGLATDQRTPREEQTVAAGTPKTDGSTRTHLSRAHSRRSSQHPPTVPEPSPPAERRPSQPATPQRPRSKRGEGKAPSSANTSLLSLLSDEDDDEDEISFTHSDFTPSGHHRILVHRPFPQLSTTPRFSSSKMDKKKRASLLHGRSSSAKPHKISKTPRTPRSAGSERVGSASHKELRRKSRQLARSVVRVVHRRDSDDHDREGSVVQTPGGSKRRCGVEGWKCERDFCFVCME